MEPIVVQDPGSNIVITVSKFELRTAKTYYELAEFLASRFQHYWPAQKTDGTLLSVDQEFKWRGRCAEVGYADGIILMARHTSGNDRIIGVAVSEPTMIDGEINELVNGAAFDSERVETVMRDALREQWKHRGAVLGKETFEMRPNGTRARKWVTI